MQNFENSPQIVAVKDVLRELFLSMLETLADTFIAFYEWLKSVPLPVPPPMLKMFSNNKANFILFSFIVLYILFINIKSYVIFSVDKKSAIKKKERIPERVLFNHMWMGGAVGSALAMFILRHKTQHRNFTVTVMILLFVQLAMFSFILGFLGFWTFF